MYVKKYNIDDFSNHLENNNLIIKDWFYNNKKYKILKYNKKNF